MTLAPGLLPILLMCLGYTLLLCGSLMLGSVFMKALQRKPQGRARWLAAAGLTIAGLLLAWYSISCA